MRLISTKVLATIVAFLALSSHALEATRAALTAPSGNGSYGGGVWLQGVVFFGENCPAPGNALPAMTTGSITVKREGVAEQTKGFYRSFYRGCGTAGNDFVIKGLPFGRHTFTLEYSGAGWLADSTSDPLVIDVVPDYTRVLPSGGKLLVGIAEPNLGEGFSCGGRDILPAATGSAPPQGVRFEDGVLRYAFSGCRYNCGTLCPGNQPSYPAQRVLLEFPAPVPADATFLIRRERPGGLPAAWQPLQGTVDGSRVAFMLQGDDSSSEMHGEIAMARGGAAYGVQDFWWGGSAENGWGVNIAQSGEQLFAAFYIYRDDGTPVWVAMPGGRWDAAHRNFEGDLYIPTGSPYYAYAAGSLKMGQAAGSARLRFASRDSATLEYKIGDKAGSKALSRFLISPRLMPVQGLESGLWWAGPAQNGWGISISRQDSGWFASWYTYGADGQPAWFYATLDPFGAYSSKLYAARSSPWIGATYDPARMEATEVGFVRFTFEGPAQGRGIMQYRIGDQGASIPIERFPF